MNHRQKVTAYDVLENGLCTIRTEGEFSPELVYEVSQCIQFHIQETGLPPGILLDVRRSAPLSLVRVSTLLDKLSRFTVPLAVVFLWPQQLELAGLLHPTLPHRDKVAYFTDIGEAAHFLARRAFKN